MDDIGLSEGRPEGLRLEWPAVRRVSLIVRHRRGVPAPPPHWAFLVEGEAGTVTVPASQTTAFLSLAHHLGGFDHRLVQTTLARGTTTMVTVFPTGGAER